MFLFLSKSHKGRASNHSDVGLFRGGYRDTLNYNGVAMRSTMMEAEFGVKHEGILGKANKDIMPANLREAQNNRVVTKLGYEHEYILLITINGNL